MYICKDGQKPLEIKLHIMFKRILVMCLMLLPFMEAFAQDNGKISRKQEIELLRQANKEAAATIGELTEKLAVQVKAMETLVNASKEVETLKAENSRLSAQLDSTLVAQTKPQQENGIVPIALFFEVGRGGLGAKERVNLEFYVENAIKANPWRIFTIEGIDDGLSGERSTQLMMQRCEHVYNLLLKKYGIPAEQVINKGLVSKDSFGSTNLNRVVIIK